MKHLKTYNEINNSQFDGLESLDEGFKEIALAILMLSGATLSGQNKQIAQKSLNDVEIVQQINNTLNDEAKLNVVINKVSDKLPQAGKLIQKNADKLKASIENISNKQDVQTREVETSDVNVLINRLRQGYSISDVEVTQDTILPEGSIVSVEDVIELDWSSDNFFQTGTFNLTETSKDSIKIIISGLNEMGADIQDMEIVSSTDKEPIKMGNQRLAQLRASSVKSEVVKLYDGEVKTTTLPDSGGDLYSSNMSRSERQEARVKTSKDRYVKVKISVTYEAPVETATPTYNDIVKKYNYKLVKVTKKVDSKHKVKPRKAKNFKFKSMKKHNGSFKTTLCPNW